MNSGRIRDQWHTLTRSGRVAARMACVDGWRLECADRHAMDDSADWFARLCGGVARDDEVVVYRDGVLALRSLTAATQRYSLTRIGMPWTTVS